MGGWEYADAGRDFISAVWSFFVRGMWGGGALLILFGYLLGV